MLGAAHIARAFCSGVAGSETVSVVAVASRDGRKARAFAEQCGIERSYASYEELLVSRDIDAVYIPFRMACTRRVAHAQRERATKHCARSRLPQASTKPVNRFKRLGSVAFRWQKDSPYRGQQARNKVNCVTFKRVKSGVNWVNRRSFLGAGVAVMAASASRTTLASCGAPDHGGRTGTITPIVDGSPSYRESGVAALECRSHARP